MAGYRLRHDSGMAEISKLEEKLAREQLTDHLYLERLFQTEVENLCAQARFAREQIELGLAGNRPTRTWFGVHSVLIISANVSKILWGEKRGPVRARQVRSSLRGRIGVSESSPLRSPMIRHGFEHIDKEIIRWWETDANHYVGRHIVRQIDSFPTESSRFGTLNPDTWVVGFRDEKPVPLKELLDELETLDARLSPFTGP